MESKIIFKKKNATDKEGGLFIENYEGGDSSKASKRTRESLGVKLTKEHFTKHFNKGMNLFNPNIDFDYEAINTLIKDRLYNKKVKEEKKIRTSFYEFYSELGLLHSNPSTRASHQKSLKKLMKFDPNTQFKTIDENFVIRYFNYMKGIPLRPSTIKTYMVVFKAVLKKASKKGLISMPYDYFEDIRHSNNGYENNKVLSKSDLIKILKFNEPSHKYFQCRNQFLLSVFCNGIRCSDVLLLKCSDFKKDHILIRAKKTDKIMKVPYNDKIIEILIDIYGINVGGVAQLVDEMYQGIDNENISVDFKLDAVLDHLSTLSNEYLFDIKNKDKNYKILKDYDKKREFTPIEELKFNNLRANYIRHTKELHKICKLEVESISSHSARYSYTNLMIDTGADIYDISKTLGHSSLSVTESYIKKNFSTRANDLAKKLSNQFSNFNLSKEEEK